MDFKMKVKWYPVTEYSSYLDDDERERKYSISTDPKVEGWDTEGGHIGLPLNLALYICRVLNKHAKDAPFENDYGEWKMKTVAHRAIDKKEKIRSSEKSVFVRITKG